VSRSDTPIVCMTQSLSVADIHLDVSAVDYYCYNNSNKLVERMIPIITTPTTSSTTVGV
jgi:hypothetical protein